MLTVTSRLQLPALSSQTQRNGARQPPSSELSEIYLAVLILRPAEDLPCDINSMSSPRRKKAILSKCGLLLHVIGYYHVV